MAVMDSPRAWRGAGSGQAVQGALADQVAFHLDGHGGDHEHCQVRQQPSSS
ncbi:hypothetical protein [Nonomuraea recticatena]|uniref:hypothetical protein n=1 Tax=Nonomuraea recticatena TaxID=46178 RepID=UPI0031F80276